MKKRTSDIVIFVLSLTALIISLVMLRIYGAYEIEYGGGTLVIDGGWFMIMMNVIRVAVLFLLCILSGIRLYKNSK